jgi:hypothetical protein
LLANISPYDLTFVASAVAFNLLIAAIFIAKKLGWERLVNTFGILWLWLLVPLTVVFVVYRQIGTETRVLFYFGLIFLYMLVELLLDYVLKIDFRSKPVTHVPYIILEYVALFSLIAISFVIDRNWGIIVSICFWILMGSLVYLFWDKITKRKRSK